MGKSREKPAQNAKFAVFPGVFDGFCAKPFKIRLHDVFSVRPGENTAINGGVSPPGSANRQPGLGGADRAGPAGAAQFRLTVVRMALRQCAALSLFESAGQAATRSVRDLRFDDRDR
jgi:hypothetical protein